MKEYLVNEFAKITVKNTAVDIFWDVEQGEDEFENVSKRMTNFFGFKLFKARK